MASGYLPDDTPPGTSPAPLSPLPKAPIGQLPAVSSPIKKKFRAPSQVKAIKAKARLGKP
jgi:hypothetical protein